MGFDTPTTTGWPQNPDHPPGSSYGNRRDTKAGDALRVTFGGSMGSRYGQPNGSYRSGVGRVWDAAIATTLTLAVHIS